MENHTINISADKLKDFISQTFVALGFNAEKATRAALVLVMADLRGIDSHGVARLPGYVRLIRDGRIDPTSDIAIEHQTPSTALVDANKGLGLVTAQESMNIAIEKAKAAGSGWVAIRNSSHFGVAVAHAEVALEHDMIGFAMTNASPLVAPAGGIEPMLGTNPICVTIPAGEERPVIIDMATTVAANGKLEIAQRNGKTIPDGWVQTKEGNKSQNPDELKSGGTLLPLGSDLLRSSYKGFCLGSFVDIFSGVLSGANFGPWVPPFVSFLGVNQESVGEGIGHFVGAWRVDAFRPADEFKAGMDQWIRRMRASKPSPGVDKVIIPGEPEFERSRIRTKSGIQVQPKVWESIKQLQEELRIQIDV